MDPASPRGIRSSITFHNNNHNHNKFLMELLPPTDPVSILLLYNHTNT